MTTQAIRGPMLSFSQAPGGGAGEAAYDYLEDGLLLVENGLITQLGDTAGLLPRLAKDIQVDHYPGKLIMPGFIDLHIHYPQTQVIASYGAQLLEWLEKYTFVEELKYADPSHAAAGARFFLDELLRHGTTTAAVYCTVSPGSVEAFFAESERRNTRMIAGKVLMDRNAPPALCDTAQDSYDDSRRLIEKWHGRGRQLYAITPRFAITSTEAQLEAAGTLKREFPDTYLQTHISENREEVLEAARLFPWSKSYAHIYDRFGLLGDKTLLGHCIHLSEPEMQRMSEAGAVAALCPTSNLFIGSGLFDLAALHKDNRPVRTGLGTDVGGGTSYSMLQTAAEAYKVMQLQGQNLPPFDAFHMITHGNACALSLGDKIGRLAVGYEADIVVLNPAATPPMAHRMETAAGDLAATLFVLMTLGDDRAIHRTYIAGKSTRR
ncbi:MAG: guanine deaminase [Alphaproteobacteria bacterium]